MSLELFSDTENAERSAVCLRASEFNAEIVCFTRKRARKFDDFESNEGQ